MLGTVIGVFCGGLVHDVKPLGLDYALTAMFLALLVPQCVSRLHVLVAIVTAILSLSLKLAGMGQWNVVVATVLGATLGVILPSFVIITVISYVLKQFESLRAVKYAFLGVRAGVLALILKAFWNMARQIPRKAVSCCIAAAAFVLAALVKLNVLLVIVLCVAALAQEPDADIVEGGYHDVTLRSSSHVK